MLRFVIAIVLSSCGGKTAQTPAAPPTPPPDATPASTPVVEKQKTCDQDPEITKHARPAYDCAIAAMGRGEFDIADALAETIMEKFPYSKIAVLSELLRADVLAARSQWAEAAEAYDLFAKFHPTHEQIDAVKKKRDDAKAKSGK